MGLPMAAASRRATLNRMTVLRTEGPYWSRRAASVRRIASRPRVVHGGKDVDRRLAAGPLGDDVDRLGRPRQAVHAEEPQVHRHDDLGGRHQGVDRQDAQAGPAVDQDEVVPRRGLFQEPAQRISRPSTPASVCSRVARPTPEGAR